MAKKAENEEELTPEVIAARKKVEATTKEKVVEAIEGGVPAGKAVDIIGEVAPPKNPEDPDDVKEFFVRLDGKLDKLISFHESEPDPDEPEPEVVAEPPPPEKKWWELYWE